MDGNFNPKIADFGNAIENAINLNYFFGAKPYIAPELLRFVPYDGFKVDIFSLRVTLMYLTFCFPGLFEASKYCNFYRKIMLNKREDYINNLKTYVKEELSAEFQDLFLKMVAYKPQNRPSIHEVLEHKWLKSYFELNDEQKKSLEGEIVAEFKDRFDKIQKSITKEIEKSNMD